MASKPTTDTRLSFSARQKPGSRDYKAPLGPRPPDFTSSKRINSDASTTSSVTLNTRQAAVPTAASEPFLGLSARRATANFDFVAPKTPEESEAKKARNRSLSSSLKRPDGAVKQVGQQLGLQEPPTQKPKHDKHSGVPKDASSFSVNNNNNNIYPLPSVTGPYSARREPERSSSLAGSNVQVRQPILQEQPVQRPKLERLVISRDGPFSASSDNIPTPTLATSASLARRENTALRAALLSTASASASNIHSGSSVTARTRRQSQFPLPTAPPSIPGTRQPRKSIGPGFVMSNANDNLSENNTDFTTPTTSAAPVNSGNQAAPARPVGRVVRKVSNPRAKPRTSLTTLTPKPTSVKPDTVATAAAAMTNPNPITNPMQTSQLELRDSLDQLQMLSLETAADGVLGGNAMDVINQTENRQSATSPSYMIRKLSSASSHTGGLGARTISPTDARKHKLAPGVKRPPSLSNQSPSPEEDSTTSQAPHSPPPSRYKSTTPTSSWETPEVVLRFSTGRSLSSRSSYSSLRPSSSSQQNRAVTGTLPARARNVHSSASGILEAVPPVPAIPKAYESPRETGDGADEQPFFSAFEDQPLTADHSSADSDFSKKLAQDPGHVVNERPMDGPARRHKRGFTLDNRSETGKTQQLVKGNFRQSQPQARLPPLNFPPLSNPTAAKLAAISKRPQEHNNSESSSARTPPPTRSWAKTPTTPMTASKATFSDQEIKLLNELDSRPQLRSNTSYGHTRSATSSGAASGTCSPINFVTPSPAPPRRNFSPFISTSAPKNTFDLRAGQLQDGRQNTVKDVQHAVESSKTKNVDEPPATPLRKDSLHHSPAQSQNEGSGGHTSIRRRLSLSWRKSTTAAAAAAKGVQGSDGQSKDSVDMPPPKFPASAQQLAHSTTNSNTANSSSKLLRKQSKKEGELKAAAVNDKTFSTSLGSQDGSVSKATQERRVHSTQPNSTQSSSRASSSLLSPMHKLLGSRSSSTMSTPQPQMETRVNSDTAAADEEMRRLAGKRKEFEAAAKELTELSRRASAKERMSPGQACQVSNLNIYERGEIIDYRDVYFCGLKNAKKLAADLNSQTSNFGFDDERGDYNIVIGDHLGYRYEIIDLLGKGSFGQVVRCIDHKAGKLVAVKIIRNKKRFHQQALVEVNILARIREWDPDCMHRMISFTQSFYFRGHLCISTELLGLNLYEFIKAHDFRGFSIKLIRRFTQQMLSSLVLLQSRNVIHCDLKPENILLAHPLRSDIKVIDFGSSCFQNEKVYTYIQSRFYRSPEVILGMDYGLPIDMWSLGCILAELLTGYPIFPGENEQEQLACIMEVFGPPEKHLIERSSRKKLFFDSLGKPRVTVSSKGKRRRPSSKTLNQVLKCDNESFIDFIAKCLRWDPERRLKPDEAMNHAFITGIKPVPPSSVARPQQQPQGMVNGTKASPAKRYTIQAAFKPRPLPEASAATLSSATPSMTAAVKSGVGSVVGTPSTSPIKGMTTPRRHSAMTATVQPPSVGVKRASNAVMGGSALPRVAQTRTASGRADLASAAAIASLRQK